MGTGPDEPKSRYLRYLEVVTGPLEDKRRWRQYKARIKTLPENYRTAVEALERYLMHFGPGDGAEAASMYEDLADLFEQSAASATPIRDIVGEDPVEFAEAFVANYPVGRWISKERDRLTGAIERAAGEDTGKDTGKDTAEEERTVR
jgi:DNA-binding ferritin-like protein (Dps family)